MAENFDLFGDPIPANWGRRGRPPHVRSNENINKVMMLTGLGWNNERMANALGITLPTFRKHYFSLVNKLRSSARDAIDATYAMKLWQQVQEGNTGAMRLWMIFMDRNDRMDAEQALAAIPADKPAAEKLGKKMVDERRALDADADLMAELEQEAATQDVARH